MDDSEDEEPDRMSRVLSRCAEYVCSVHVQSTVERKVHKTWPKISACMFVLKSRNQYVMPDSHSIPNIMQSPSRPNPSIRSSNFPIAG